MPLPMKDDVAYTRRKSIPNHHDMNKQPASPVAKKRMVVPPPSSPAPKARSAVATYRAKAAIPPPSTPPPKAASKASQWRNNHAKATSNHGTEPTSPMSKKSTPEPTRRMSKQSMEETSRKSTPEARPKTFSVDYTTSNSDDVNDICNSISSLVHHHQPTSSLLDTSSTIADAKTSTASRSRAVPLSGSNYQSEQETNHFEIISAESKMTINRNLLNLNEDKYQRQDDHYDELTALSQMEEMGPGRDEDDGHSQNEMKLENGLEEKQNEDMVIIEKNQSTYADDKESLDPDSSQLRTALQLNQGEVNEDIDESEEDEELKPRKIKKKVKKNATVHLFHPRKIPCLPNDLKEFIINPLPEKKGTIVRCFVERTRPVMGMPVVYTFLVEVNSSSGRPIMYARAKPTGRQTHYVISLNQEDLSRPRESRSSEYLGKLRSTNGSEYMLYDDGDGLPENDDGDETMQNFGTYELEKLRCEVAYIWFQPKARKNPDVRRMQVALPGVSKRTKCMVPWKATRPTDSIAAHFKAVSDTGAQNVVENDTLICLHKRETKYDALSSCIVDFKSRATIVSVKNFQLIHSVPSDDTMTTAYEAENAEYFFIDEGTSSVPTQYVLLQMGKVGRDCFNVDFQHPLSMLQAFAICLSRFDTKHK